MKFSVTLFAAASAMTLLATGAVAQTKTAAKTGAAPAADVVGPNDGLRVCSTPYFRRFQP